MGAVIVSAHKKSNMPKWLLNCLYKLLLGGSKRLRRLGKGAKVQRGIAALFAKQCEPL